MKEHGDEIGLLWQTDVKIGRTSRGKKIKPIPPKPTGYKPPTGGFKLEGLDQLAIDIETHDPDLKSKGPGVRRDGYVVGIALATLEKGGIYYPLRHESGDNCEQEKVINWLKSEAPKFKGELVGTNLQYDLDFLNALGIEFTNAKIRDIQIAEPLLDENRISYKLNILAKDYLGIGKTVDGLHELYGDNWIERIRDCHAAHIEKYGVGDVELPLKIMELQKVKLKEQNLMPLFEMESALTPLLLKMRQVGVRVDIDKAQKAYDETLRKAEIGKKQIKDIVGFNVDVWSNDSVGRAFDKQQIQYNKTKTGKPSFRKEWLSNHPSEIAKIINEIRRNEKIGGTFIKNYILDGHVNGRLHCTFNQLKSDGSGTVSGRFSSSNPNLQNIPVRDPELGPLMRSMFIPEEDCQWGSADWSQIEFRFLVHYAAHMGYGGAAKAAKMYEDDKTTDFHDMAADITGKTRAQAKSINFGVVYGMGVKKMAESLNTDMDSARIIMEEFHTELPFIKRFYDQCIRQVCDKGYIKTILNRRRRFDLWEGINNHVEPFLIKGEIKARKQWGNNIKRSHTHKALNSLIQGSAADLMKKAMLDMWDAGIFNILIPHLTVHDEMNVSVPRTKAGDEAFKEMIHIMETSMKLNVPVLCDAKLANNWAEAH